MDKLSKDMPESRLYKEPIANWGSWLDLFYTNPEKYAFPFQMKVLLEFMYLDPSESLTTTQSIITERCPLDSLYVFTKTLQNEKIISYMEYNLYSEFVEKIGWTPHHIIYLQTSPHVCHNRVHTRMRKCESDVELSYITSLHHRYEDWLVKKPGDEPVQYHVTIINGDDDPNIVYTHVKNAIRTYNS